MSPNQMNNTVFITGPVGMVGSYLVQLFLQLTDWSVCLLIHKTAVDMSLENILTTYCNIKNPSDYIDRISCVHGDITEDNLGLSSSSYQKLTDEITHIVHCAASTRFDLPLEEARKINRQGTQRVLSFAGNCSNLQHFGFMSTVYVSGKRTGQINEVIYEDNPAGFANTYEQSKFEAELCINKHIDKLPISVYRLSTVIGNSQTGVVNHFTAPHQTLRVMYLGLASMMPGTPEYSVDLISSDYTARTVFDLFTAGPADSLVYHIVSGHEKSYTLQEVIDESFTALAHCDPQWAAKEYPKPSIAPPQSFELFMKTAEAARNPLIHGVLTALQSFAHQLNYPKSFAVKNTTSIVPSYAADVPDIRDYYEKIVSYCVKTQWGKKTMHD